MLSLGTVFPMCSCRDSWLREGRVVGQRRATAMRGRRAPNLPAVAQRTQRRSPEKSEEETRDGRVQRISAKEWKGLVTTCSPADPANHSQLSALEEASLVSEGLEKRLKECEPLYRQVSADTASLSQPPRAAGPGLQLWGKPSSVTQNLNASGHLPY